MHEARKLVVQPLIERSLCLHGVFHVRSSVETDADLFSSQDGLTFPSDQVMGFSVKCPEPGPEHCCRSVQLPGLPDLTTHMYMYKADCPLLQLFQPTYVLNAISRLSLSSYSHWEPSPVDLGM